MSLFDLFKATAASQTRDALTPEPPWKAKTVIAAGLTTLAGMAGWISDLAPLAVARFGGSYIGGFFLGWAFRRFVKLVFVIGAFAVAGLALMKNVGWLTTDWGQVERHISHHLTAVRQGAEGVKQFLASYWPSAGAAAAGVFLGFRKK
ncbi:MAG: FUN14 domain-containing protein [Nitrospira sp.]|nr:FUN14 domain-containing protein [Nitrospira sp.]